MEIKTPKDLDEYISRMERKKKLYAAKPKPERIKVYVFDFGDTNIINRSLNVIMDMAKVELKEHELENDKDAYTIKITVKTMSEKAYKKLTEWS